MGIDGIGKRGGAGGVGTPDPTSTSNTSGTGRSFSAELRETAGPEAVRGSNALEDFKAGRIDMNGYLDQKVNAATAHLEGLPPGDLAQVRSLLREQLTSDPGFAALVEKATGSRPPTEGE